MLLEVLSTAAVAVVVLEVVLDQSLVEVEPFPVAAEAVPVGPGEAEVSLPRAAVEELPSLAAVVERSQVAAVVVLAG